MTATQLMATSKGSSVFLSWKVVEGNVGWRVKSWEARVEEQHWAGRSSSLWSSSSSTITIISIAIIILS